MTEKTSRNVIAATISVLLASAPGITAAEFGSNSLEGRSTPIKHVLLISIDGMHALDLENCTKGLSTINQGDQYCPNIRDLTQTGISYTQALAPRPSDSFPGTAALMTGGTPISTGMYYDVSYDRALSPPAKKTPYGIVSGNCPGDIGTQVGYDEEIDKDYTKLDGGGAIDPNYLPRDPKKGCAPVYPHEFIRANTMFEVVREAGGYTAWSDKHLAYEFPQGKSGKGVNDLWSPEINSIPVPLASVADCDPLPDPAAATSSNAWTDSFANVRCYDAFKVNAILNEIEGKNHDGSKKTRVPNVFGMNFQAVSVGQKLVEKSSGERGGYLDAQGTPSPALLSQIEFVDHSIGRFVDGLKAQGLYESTLIIISAKHGQSAIDPNRVHRIPADDPNGKAPSDLLGGVGTGLKSDTQHLVVQALEDDVSLIWLRDRTRLEASVDTLEQNEAMFGGGEIFFGTSLNLLFNSVQTDSRVPDIVIEPNVGIVYTGGTKKIAEHGGFANDDRNVMLLISNPRLSPKVCKQSVETRQIPPTILKVLGLNPQKLEAVQKEHTEVLPGLPLGPDEWSVSY